MTKVLLFHYNPKSEKQALRPLVCLLFLALLTCQSANFIEYFKPFYVCAFYLGIFWEKDSSVEITCMLKYSDVGGSNPLSDLQGLFLPAHCICKGWVLFITVYRKEKICMHTCNIKVNKNNFMPPPTLGGWRYYVFWLSIQPSVRLKSHQRNNSECMMEIS